MLPLTSPLQLLNERNRATVSDIRYGEGGTAACRHGASTLLCPPRTVLKSVQGATPAQARAALKKYNDVMQAAEHIFDGAFDHITDDSEDVEMKSVSERAPSTSITRTAVGTRAITSRWTTLIYALQTPDDEEDGAEDGNGDDYGDDAEEDDDENEYSECLW